jgi:hypothetical protein
MAQTLVSLLVHIVFSTRNRANLIAPEIEADLYKYISGTLRNLGSPCLKIRRDGESRTLAGFSVQEYRVGLLARGDEEKLLEMDQTTRQISAIIQLAGRVRRV